MFAYCTMQSVLLDSAKIPEYFIWKQENASPSGAGEVKVQSGTLYLWRFLVSRSEEQNLCFFQYNNKRKKSKPGHVPCTKFLHTLKRRKKQRLGLKMFR